MGYHYLPQYYLKGFTSVPKGKLWVYKKGAKERFESYPKKVANINKLYPENLEQYLANDIEFPANKVLDKIRRQQLISLEDKTTLGRYMVTMWKRVPAANQRMQNMFPQCVHEYSEYIERECATLTEQQPQHAVQVELNRKQIQKVLDRMVENPPAEIWHLNIPPESTPLVLQAITGMTWMFLTFNERPAFLTCDNPLFHFTSLGVGKPESEISFPVSSNIILWGTWRTDLTPGYVSVKEQVVKEMNRRTVSNALQYIFHSRNEDWIESFLNKESWRLNLLNLTVQLCQRG